MDQGSEHVYSFAFFPGFNAAASAAAATDAATDAQTTGAHPCCLATASRGQPARLWDCLTGSVRATYAASSAVAPEGRGATDAVAAPLAVAFSPDGKALAAGYPRGDLVLFDMSRPSGSGGTELAWQHCRSAPRRGKKRRRRGRQEGEAAQEEEEEEEGQLPRAATAADTYVADIRLPGPIGCVTFSGGDSSGGGHVLAAGSYGGSIGLFDVRVSSRRPAAETPSGEPPPSPPLLDHGLPVAFGKQLSRQQPPKITADAPRPAGGGAASMAPVLAIAPGGGASAGVTQLSFAPGGQGELLFAGYRGGCSSSARIDGWDLRALREPVVAVGAEGAGAALQLWRRGEGFGGAPGKQHPGAGFRHQRIQFGLDAAGRHFATGSGLRDGVARVFELASAATTTTTELRLAQDGTVVNAVSFCPADASLVAVASGQREYLLAPSSSSSGSGEGGESEEEEEGGDDDEGEDGMGLPRASLALWRLEGSVS